MVNVCLSMYVAHPNWIKCTSFAKALSQTPAENCFVYVCTGLCLRHAMHCNIYYMFVQKQVHVETPFMIHCRDDDNEFLVDGIA